MTVSSGCSLTLTVRPSIQPEEDRKIPLLYLTHLRSINDMTKAILYPEDPARIAEGLDDVLSELNECHEPWSMLRGQPTFKAMLHLAAAYGHFRFGENHQSVSHLKSIHELAMAHPEERYR